MSLRESCLVLVSLGALGACMAPPQVEVDGATYRGVMLDDGEVAEFLGIPFAEPPVGERRWAAPVPLKDRRDRNATRHAAACMQGAHMVDWYRRLVGRFGGDPDTFPLPGFSEDCLYLNVWTPALDENAGLPVMVWIHGGSHTGGWSYEPNYEGDSLARRGVVVVSIAYRLDIFGFFSHPDLEVSNFGLLDQVAALNWVRKNIRSFGGDEDNVTVFGESAGAASAGYLLASPLARGLFRRLIHQSAGYQLAHDDHRESFLDEGLRLERRVLKGAADPGIAGLRKASAEALLVAAAEVYEDYRPDVVVDGHSLPASPRHLLSQGGLLAVDLLIGTNADEWKMYLDAGSNAEDVAQWLRERGINESALDDEQDPLRRLDRLVTAEQFVCPSLALADYMATAGKATYVYYFSRERAGKAGMELGAYHGSEIPYIFDKHDDWLPTDETDREITGAMSRYWTAFARTGNPNAAGLSQWPAWASGEQMMLDIGDTVRATAHPEGSLCALLAGATD